MLKFLLRAAQLSLALAGGVAQATTDFHPQERDPVQDPSSWHRVEQLDGKAPQAMEEDNEGNMWFANAETLMRYDGFALKSYARPRVTDDRVEFLFPMLDGRILLGTASCLFEFHQGKWREITVGKSAVSFPAYAIARASDGGVWIGSQGMFAHITDSRLVYYVSQDRLAQSASALAGEKVIAIPSQALPNESVRAIREDRHQQVWTISGDAAPVCFSWKNKDAGDRDHFIFSSVGAADGYYTTPSTRALGILTKRTIYEVSDGEIWVASGRSDVGLNRFDPRTRRWTYVDLSQIAGTDNLVFSIFETRDGTLWAGGIAQVFALRDGTWSMYRSPAQPVSASRINIIESKTGTLWVMGYGDDVYRVDYRGQERTEFLGINYQCDDGTGGQWFVCADNAIVQKGADRWRRFSSADGLMRFPYGVRCTARGEIWAYGSDGETAAAARFDGRSWNTFRHFANEFPSIIDPRAVAESSDGSLWFPSYVDAYNNSRVSILQYNPKLGPPESRASWVIHRSGLIHTSYGLAQAADGRIFSGDYEGLAVFDGTEWKRPDIVPAGAIDALCTGSDGAIWIGTRGRGLIKWDGRKTTQYTTENGLPNNAISSVYADQSGKIWVSTVRGVSVFDGKDWAADAFPQDNLSITREGGGCLRSKDGSIWVNLSSRPWFRRSLPESQGSALRFDSFRTIRFRQSFLPPRAVITYAARQVDYPGDTSIHWSGLDEWSNTPTRQLQYSYRLDDGAWSLFSSETSHVFLRLSSGVHHVAVRARNTQLVISPTPAVADFEVIPPVWLRTWFLCLVGSSIAAVAIQSVRIVRRDARLRRANDVLSREIARRTQVEHALRDRTFELENTARELTSHKGRLEREIDERTRMEVHIRKTHRQLIATARQAGMAEIAASVLHNIGNVLNSVNVSVGVLADIVGGIRASSLAKLGAKLAQPEATGAAPNESRLMAEFVDKFSDVLTKNKNAAAKEIEILRAKINDIIAIMSAQQKVAEMKEEKEIWSVREVIDEAVMLAADSWSDNPGVAVDQGGEWRVSGVRRNATLILVSMIRHAYELCRIARIEPKVSVGVAESERGAVAITVRHAGAGLSEEDVAIAFTPEYSGRFGDAGVDLHTSAILARKMGGALRVIDEGAGHAKFLQVQMPAESRTDLV